MNIEDENFALKFELDALADLTVRNEAERWVPGFMWQQTEAEHRSRYELALSYVKDKKVLDVACGSGYGSYLLAEKGKAKGVMGFDLNEKSIRYGNIRYPYPNVIRKIQDAQQFDLPDSFDVVVSFETIEHLSDYRQFLGNIKRSLKPKGVLIISTPIVQKTRTTCSNPYHLIEWSFSDFQKILKEFFEIEKVYTQSLAWKESFLDKVKRKIFSTKSPVDFSLKKQMDFVSDKNLVAGYQVVVCKKE